MANTWGRLSSPESAGKTYHLYPRKAADQTSWVRTQCSCEWGRLCVPAMPVGGAAQQSLPCQFQGWRSATYANDTWDVCYLVLLRRYLLSSSLDAVSEADNHLHNGGGSTCDVAKEVKSCPLTGR